MLDEAHNELQLKSFDAGIKQLIYASHLNVPVPPQSPTKAARNHILPYSTGAAAVGGNNGSGTQQHQ